MKSISHEEFVSRIEKRFNCKVLSKYINARTPVYIQSDRGIHHIKKPTGIIRLKTNNLSPESLVDKLEYFNNQLYNTRLRQSFKIITKNINSVTKPIVIETEYGKHKVCPQSLSESIPTIQSAIDKTQYYKNRLLSVGCEYDLSRVVYIKSRKPRIIGCKYHGWFKVKGTTKNYKIKCPKCAFKYNKSYNHLNKTRLLKKQTYLYFVNYYDDNENFYKIGLTVDLKKRLRRVPYKYKIINVFKLDSFNAYFLEQNLLKYHWKHSYSPKKNFGGYTECFSKLMLYNEKITM